MFLMKDKIESHESLLLMFQRGGVPTRVIADGSKEHVGGTFAPKCKEYGCYLKQTEPYYIWQNSV